MILGPPKTERTSGHQLLGPTVVSLLRDRLQLQLDDRAKLGEESWPTVEYEGERIDLVFTSAAGTPTLRQRVDRGIRNAAVTVGLDPSHLGTHTGRRSVVTNLFATGAFDLADVASYVGHADVATTKGYVQNEGDRPLQVNRKAFELLDPGPPANDD